MTAVELGTDVVKLFPTSIGGVALLRSLLGRKLSSAPTAVVSHLTWAERGR